MSQINLGNPKKSGFGVALTALIVAFVAFSIVAGFYADWQWFAVLDRTDVYVKELVVKAALFVVVGGLTALFVWLSASLAYRARPFELPRTPEEFALARYREALDSFRRAAFVIAPLFFGALIGLSAAGQWRVFLQWQNSTPFNQVDAQFGKDISFYVFELPFYRTILSFAFTALISSLLINLAIHYLYGSLRPTSSIASNVARRHLMRLLIT